MRKVLCVALVVLFSAGICYADDLDERYGARNIPTEEVARLWKVFEMVGDPPTILTAGGVENLLEQIKWENNDKAKGIGSPNAIKGGTLRYPITSYPATLRTVGKNSNSTFNTLLEGLTYESLMATHPISLKYVPALANRWFIAFDKMTFFFKMDPRARFSDGHPVTAYDYVASYDLYTDEGIQDPFQNDYWKKYERPIALTRDVVMVKSKQLNWRSFLSCAASLPVLPQHIIGKMTGKEYLEEYQFKLMVGSGPYVYMDSKTNINVTMKRRDDWWGDQVALNRGTSNFGTLIFECITDENLMKEKLKKGDLDFMQVGIAREWHQDFTPERMDKIARGWIQKRKIYTHKAAGTSGLAYNMRKPPFDDIRVRKAIAHLYNRELMMEKLFFNEYIYTDSFYANSPYESDDHPEIRYDPDEAIDLLEDADWSQADINDDGYLVKDGKIFEITLPYVGKSSERIYTIFQEDLKEVGIKLSLKSITWATLIKDLGERSFSLIPMGYTGLIFPNPESSMHSKFADLKDNNNIWGFKNARVDEICEKYPLMFDLEDRIEAVKEIDSIATKEYLWCFGWYAPHTRILYWNKFGAPGFLLSRFERDTVSIISYWWFDAEKEQKLKTAVAREEPFPQDGTTYYKGIDIKYWDEYIKEHGESELGEF